MQIYINYPHYTGTRNAVIFCKLVSSRVEFSQKKVNETGNVQRKAGNGPPRTVRTEENIDKVSTAILSQDHKPGTHETPNQIAKYTGISRTSVCG